MKLVTQETDHALAVLCYMAGESFSDCVSARDLAEALDAPYGFLRKILRRLALHGIVSSTRGKGGGFHLLVSPAEVSVYKVMEIFQGPLYVTECVTKTRVCSRKKTCPLCGPLNEVGVRLSKELDGITIAGLVK
ncbi:MAG: Rrf2 family transcriptional regulator [Kiritimatiellae bacterium]|nr:Rrf2 family transcriptional regulator [Kiritimatiellia bacterium]